MKTRPEDDTQPRASRFLAGLPAVLHVSRKDFPCEAFNLSRTGVLLFGELPSRVPATVRVTLKSAFGDLCLDSRAKVARGKRDPEGKIEMGLAFHELDDSERLVLDSMIARIVEGMTPAVFEALKPGAPPAKVREALDRLPVAHKITMAARAAPRERDYLRQDNNPQVLEGLARNPTITLPEIKSLAHLPSLQPTTLKLMAEDPRWARDEELMLLIVSHPRTPLEVGEIIVGDLNDLAVEKLLQRPGLHPRLQIRLAKRLARSRR